MPLLRKVVFYLFTLIYLIICPLMILRLLGFVWDKQTGHWVKTGIIYASSNPPGARLYVNGRRSAETTPAIIRDLAPGNYDLRMELDGYEAWENLVPVLDKKATSVENVLLLPKHWNIRPLNNEPLLNLIPIPGNDYLLVSSDQTVKGVMILRLNKDIDSGDKESKITDLDLLFPEESIYRDAEVVRYFTVNHSPFFVMEIKIDDKHKYLWIDPRDSKQVHIEDISDLLPQTPEKLYWEPNDEKNIFAFDHGTVNRINIKEKAIYPNIAPKDVPEIRPLEAIPYLPQASQVFLINNGNTLLFRIGKNVYLKDEQGFGQPRLIQVMHVQEGTDVYFAEKTGQLYYIDDESHLLSFVQILHHKPFIPKPIAETLRL